MIRVQWSLLHPNGQRVNHDELITNADYVRWVAALKKAVKFGTLQEVWVLASGFRDGREREFTISLEGGLTDHS